jgi:hypothetical protein
MRRVTLLTAVVFFIVGVSVPLTALCQDESDTNGYAWERMSKNAEGQAMARLMVASYLRGYQAGCSMGYAMGIFELTQLLEGVEMPKKPAICGETWQAEKEKLRQVAGLLAPRFYADRMFKESPQYYVREVSSFLQTYPLCRRDSVQVLLMKLSEVWKTGASISYKDVGEKCSRQTKDLSVITLL